MRKYRIREGSFLDLMRYAAAGFVFSVGLGLLYMSAF